MKAFFIACAILCLISAALVFGRGREKEPDDWLLQSHEAGFLVIFLDRLTLGWKKRKTGRILVYAGAACIAFAILSTALRE